MTQDTEVRVGDVRTVLVRVLQVHERGNCAFASFLDTDGNEGLGFWMDRQATTASRLISRAPRPIQVGDRVVLNTGAGAHWCVVSIDGDHAWIKPAPGHDYGECGGVAYLSNLTLVEGRDDE